MNVDSIPGASSAPQRSSAAVTISRWVNEPLPDIRGLLCARDLVRLTRRPHWMLCGLSLIGKFPRMKRYRGRPLGWCRKEVLDWIARDLSIASELGQLNGTPHCSRKHPRQSCLPLECAMPCTVRNCAAHRPSTRGESRTPTSRVHGQ